MEKACLHFEYLPQLPVIQLTDPVFPGGDRHLGQFLLLANHLVNFLLEAVFGDEAVHHHVLLLPDAIGAVGSLVLYRRVPTTDRNGSRAQPLSG